MTRLRFPFTTVSTDYPRLVRLSMVCVKLMSRLRGDKARRLEDDRLAALGAASRDRSKSLCVERLTGLLRPGYDPATIAARDLNLHALQRRRASSAL